MGLARTLLLKGSQSDRLRQLAPRYKFVRNAVSRFMPGEDLEDALRAAAALQAGGISTLVTHLGENLRAAEEAEGVTRHYLQALDSIHQARLDAQISVKLTQLGLDQGRDLCTRNVIRLIEQASRLGNTLWIDMEGSPYTAVTLEIYRELRSAHRNVGVCVQAYLRRTPADLETLLPLGPSIRLVKGTYNEPATIAFPDKRDVDRQFLELAKKLLSPESRAAGTFTAVATHDLRIIDQVQDIAREQAISRDAFEFEMLYGIQRGQQLRLAREGARIRVLISYGAFWFPWFMRRLAERPANVLFVARQLFAD